jgi:uncharacterized alpha-E superfamily protein
VINVHLDLMLEHGTDSDDRIWGRMLRALGIESDDEPQQPLSYVLAHTVIHDPDSSSSIVACIMGARENARQVREQISTEMWEQLNRLFHEVKQARPEEIWESREFLAAIKEVSNLLQGITDSTMTHSAGWQFIQVGRSLERAVLVSMLVGVHFTSSAMPEASAAEYLEWIGPCAPVLRSVLQSLHCRSAAGAHRGISVLIRISH